MARIEALCKLVVRDQQHDRPQRGGLVEQRPRGQVGEPDDEATRDEEQDARGEHVDPEHVEAGGDQPVRKPGLLNRAVPSAKCGVT